MATGLRPPRLPKEWDGLSIVHLSDTHSSAVACPYFNSSVKSDGVKPDLFMHGVFSMTSRCGLMPKTLGQLAFTQSILHSGNHDWYLDAGRSAHAEQIGWTDVAGERSNSIEQAWSSIVLAGDETPWMGTHPDLASDSKPFRSFSVTRRTTSAGPRSETSLMLSGHTHGSQIVCRESIPSIP